MNTYTNQTELQKVQLIANIQQILDNKKELEEKLPTGRNVGTAHLGVMYALVELWATHYKNTKSSILRTNRGNLAHAFMCSPRSTYNYLLDFHQLDILHWVVMEEDSRGWIEIEISFSAKMFTSPTPIGSRQSDGQNDPNGKVCRIQYTNLKNNIENNPLGCGQREISAELVQKIKEEQKKEEQGQQKNLPTAKKTAPEELITLDPNFCKEFRAAPDDERSQINELARLLWKQAKNSLWNGRVFRQEVVMSSMQFLAVALLDQAAKNKELRKSRIKEFKLNPAYRSASEYNQKRMLAKFLTTQPTEVTAPYRAAFLVLSRAIEIQRENCIKKDYSTYYPTYYFSEHYDKAVKYCLLEKRTMTTHAQANAVRLDHCTAKLKIESELSKGVETLKKFGFSYCLNSLRESYKNFKQWLTNSLIPDKQKYLDRFVSQMACIHKL